MNGRPTETVERVRSRLAASLEVARAGAERSGDPATAELLLADAIARLGRDDPVCLLIECGVEELLSRNRPAAASVDALGRLHDRMRHLPAADPASMNARSLIARYTWLRGGDGDVDRGIELYAQELAARTAMLGPDDYRTRSIRACLATALRDRGTHDDLSRSLAMLREEVAHRSLRYGADHEFAGEARATLASTLLRLGEPALVTEALAIATELADGRRLRFGHHDARTLGAHLLRAHALLLASRRSAAEAEVRYVEAVARTGRDIVDRRWLEYLARAVRSQQEPAGDAVDPILVSRHLTQGQRRPGTGAGVH